MNKLLTILTLIIAGAIIISGCTKEKQVSRNRTIENGETKDRSCEDAGCLEGQTCQNHRCIDPICNECEYLENHKCIKYECCKNDECFGKQTCVNNRCMDPVCRACQYLENHRCIDYKCCSNADCDDNNPNTEDFCTNPSMINSYCNYLEIAKKCDDGTNYDKCSDSKPLYCDNGALVNNCNVCNCPTDKSNCLKKGICSSFSEKVDCENKHYKMAFILLVKNPEDATPDVLSKLSTIKNEFPLYFSTATGNGAQMDTDFDTKIISSKDSMFDISHNENANYVISNEVTKEFYKANNDVYDFLTIYTTFSTDRSSTHDLVVNNIKGIGLSVMDYSNIYGSRGKLKGINFLRMMEDDLTIEMNKLLHETGHQWCCYVGDNFNEGQAGARLEIIQQGIHFYRGLQSPSETGDAMDSDHWISNGDGTFRRENTQGVQKYHPFQLYFMGLLPEEEYSTKFQLYKYGPINFEFEKAIPYKEVNVNNIIEVEGKRECISE